MVHTAGAGVLSFSLFFITDSENLRHVNGRNWKVGGKGKKVSVFNSLVVDDAELSKNLNLRIKNQ